VSTLTHKDPDISLAGLSIWVHGWQFPDSDEFWDANWLNCTARCVANGARVEASGSFLHAPEFEAWLTQCESLAKTLKGKAALEPIEPTIQASITANSLGHMQVQVKLTADHLSQKHCFEFEADQTDVVQLVGQLRALLQRFPIRCHEKNT
jgi:hypothetical protein